MLSIKRFGFNRSRSSPVEDARFDDRQSEEPVVEHLFEDFEITQEGGGGLRVTVGDGGVWVRLKSGDAVWQGRMGRVGGT
jgi:hypothetical protein